ncbi:DUF7426 family protein [Georgenia faecalis]|uniref:DUF7426 family protein n=1 Tax=Georgenia faecalis TaxID=2483799 RepID=UPI0013DF26B9|nr:hypothetical protein [Georgenia faecalis]
MTENTLTLQVAGAPYEVPSPPAAIGLALQASYVIARARRAQKPPPAYALERMARYDDGASDLDEDSLGPAWQQMIDAGVPIHDLRRAAQAAYTWIVTGSEAAAQAVMGGGASGEAKGPGPSTSTGAASTTKRRASTSGTTSRRRTSPA